MAASLDAAREIARELPAYRAGHDSERRLAAPVVDKLRAAGMFGMLVPSAIGGGEVHAVDYVRTLSALAAGDSATAWVVMTATTTAALVPYLPRDVASAIWRDQPVMAGAFAPTATLEGERLAGKWSYVSGSRHAEWFAFGALRDRKHVFAMVPAREVTIIDNWDTLGLAGTGSHDARVDADVPDDHVTSVFGNQPWADGPLYRMPLFGLLAAGIAAVGVGIATTALHHASQLGKEPTSHRYAGWAATRARLDAARAHLDAAVGAAYATPSRVDDARGELRLAASHVAHEVVAVVRSAFHLVGGAAARTGHPLQLALRDAETMLTHRMVADRVMPAAGRAILGGGAPPDL